MTLAVVEVHVNTSFVLYNLAERGRGRPDRNGAGRVVADEVGMERVGGTVAEEGFVFVGEALALDFVNTEVVVRGKPKDLLTIPPPTWPGGGPPAIATRR
jgi:hypothetical protein